MTLTVFGIKNDPPFFSPKMGIVLLPFFNKRENSTPAFIRPILFREGEDKKGFKGERSGTRSPKRILLIPTIFSLSFQYLGILLFHLFYVGRAAQVGPDGFCGF
jgi:hypothetical protein